MTCSVIRDNNNEIKQVLASNGKESKLFKDINKLFPDKEQSLRLWAQTYTPQFKRWFENSKVVDENGEPLVVYHSTQDKFDTFRADKTSMGGFFFSTDKEEYAGEGVMSMFPSTTTMPVFLSIESPFNLKQGYDEYVGIPEDNEMWNGGKFISRDIIKDLKSKGFDGLVPNISGSWYYVAFDSNQIKSVFNKGLFSKVADNIYYQKNDNQTTDPFSTIGKMNTILQKLQNRFGIDYQLVNDKSLNWRGILSKDGKVYINLAYAGEDTLFHEYIHPFISVLKQQNPALYSSLVSELKTTKDGIEAVGHVNRLYPELGEAEQLEEALVQYLGRLAADKYNKPNSAFNRFISWLKSIFKKIGIKFEELSLNTKLSDIADFIVDDVYVADLKSAIKNATTFDKYQRVDTELTYENLYERIKDKVAILNATVKNRKQGDAFKEDINDLNEIIKNSDEITSINNFVVNAIEYISIVHKRFETLRDSVTKANTLSKQDISDNLYVLSEIQQLLNVYDTLDSVRSLYVREEMKSTDDTMAKLADAIDQKNLMIEDFKSFALSYLTEWLFPYIEPTNKALVAQGKTSSIVTKENFREQMKIAIRDISAAGFWLGTTINSQDPVSAAVALALKDIVYQNHIEDLAIKKSLVGEYDRVKGTALFTTAKSEEEFNMQFLREVQSWEQVGVDEEGKPKYDYVSRLAFHTPYLDDQFEKARREFYKEIGPRPNRTDEQQYRAWIKAVAEWYSKNTQLSSNYLSIVANKKKTLSKRQFERWFLENTKEIDEEVYQSGMKKSDFFGNKVASHNVKRGTFRIFSGELIQPSGRFRNNEFPRMMQNPYYRELYNTYKEANERLGHFGLKHGIIPQVSKGKNLFSDLKWNKGVKGNLKTLKTNAGRAVTVKADFDSNKTAQRQDETEVKDIPIYFTSMLDTEDLTTDLLSSTMKFSQMARHYQSFTEIAPNILILKTVLNGDFNLGIKGREVAKTNSKGAQIINSITKKIVPKAARVDMLDTRLNEFIDDIVYGDSEFQDTINILGNEISVNKLAGRVGLLTALQTMALNINGGISNVAIGNFNNSIEAVGGRFWNVKDWAWAHKEYFKNLPQFLGEIAGQTKSFLNDIAEHYDVPQGEFQDQYGSRVSGGKANRLLRTSTLFFLQRGGEHEIQITGMLSLMHATKVKEAGTGKEVSLYEAWEKTKGDSKRMSTEYNWGTTEDAAFRNRLHAITKNLQGIYNNFDKAMLQRRWYGKLALMFRKYMFSSFKARYGAKYVDYELGTENEGYWRAFTKKLVKEAKDYKWGMIQRMWTKEGYNEMEKAAFNKTIYELSIILGMALLAGFIGDDDEDKTWLDNETALMATRMSADITQYINPLDFIRVVRNPAASVNMIEKWIGWFSQLVFNPTEEYERAAGIAEKGDNKLYIKTLKLMPVIRQVVNFMTPEEQIKFYNLSGR